MQAIEELKKKYDTRSISQIENEAAHEKDLELKHQKSFIRALYYLDHTKRFRENPRFKNSSFDEYIKTMFDISPGWYKRLKIAFIGYPEQTEKFGPRTTYEIHDKCGPVRAAVAYKELETVPLKKATPGFVEKVIAKHEKPELKAKREETVVAKPTVESLLRQLSQKDEIIAEQERTILEQHEQIKKLKAALRAAKAAFDVGMAVIPGGGCPVQPMVN